jgi:peroxiredoxin
MKHFITTVLSSLALLLTGSVAAIGDDSVVYAVELKPVPEGSQSRLNRMESRSATLSAKLPAALKGALKKGLEDDTTVYGVMPLQVTKQGMLVAVTESPDSKSGKLYLDSNGDGDLTNDSPPDYWERRGPAAFDGTATIKVDGTPVTLRLFRYTSTFAEESPSLKNDNPLFFSREDVREGKLTWNQKTYLVLLKDLQVSGRYDNVAHEGDRANVGLYIDRNDDGKYDLRNELYDLAFPFAIDGKILELASVQADGSRLVLKAASGKAPVTERPTEIAVGRQAPEFEAKALGDRTVRFPGDYKGKIVLLTFWAVGCGPCRGVIADEVRAYERFQEDGFEVIGVSLDAADRADAVQDFCRDWRMTWPQILDSQRSNGGLAKLYHIESMPNGILMDGTTGKVLATPETLKQHGVAVTIRKVLAIREALRRE